MHRKYLILLLPVSLLLLLLVWLYGLGMSHAANVFPPDRNGDLIRDDVGLMIDRRFAGNAVAGAASRQLARAWQRAVMHDGESLFGREVENVRHAISCILSEPTLHKGAVDPQEMHLFMEQMHAQMFDTSARWQRWLSFERRANQIPHDRTPLNPCSFDLAALPG